MAATNMTKFMTKFHDFFLEISVFHDFSKKDKNPWLSQDGFKFQNCPWPWERWYDVSPGLILLQRFLVYPHDNIHEINTWKCPIETQGG